MSKKRKTSDQAIKEMNELEVNSHTPNNIAESEEQDYLNLESNDEIGNKALDTEELEDDELKTINKIVLDINESDGVIKSHQQLDEVPGSKKKETISITIDEDHPEETLASIIEQSLGVPISSDASRKILHDIRNEAEFTKVTSSDALKHFADNAQTSDEDINAHLETINHTAMEAIRDIANKKGEISASDIKNMHDLILSMERAASELIVQSSPLTEASKSHDNQKKDLAKRFQVKNILSGNSRTSFEKHSVKYGVPLATGNSKLDETLAAKVKNLAEGIKQAEDNTTTPNRITTIDSFNKVSTESLIPCSAKQVYVYNYKQGPYSLMMSSFTSDGIQSFLSRGMLLSYQFAASIELTMERITDFHSILKDYMLQEFGKVDQIKSGTKTINFSKFVSFLERQYIAQAVHESLLRTVEMRKESSTDLLQFVLTKTDISMIIACIFVLLYKNTVTWEDAGTIHILLHLQGQYYEPVPIDKMPSIYGDFMQLQDMPVLMRNLNDFRFRFTEKDHMFGTDVPHTDLKALAKVMSSLIRRRLNHMQDLAVVSWAFLADQAKISVANEATLKQIRSNPAYPLLVDIFQFEAYAVYSPSTIERIKWQNYTPGQIDLMMANLGRFVSAEMFHVKRVEIDEYAEGYSFYAEKDTDGSIAQVIISKNWEREDQQQQFVMSHDLGNLVKLGDAPEASSLPLNGLAKNYSYLGFKSLVDVKDVLFKDRNYPGITIDGQLGFESDYTCLSQFVGHSYADLKLGLITIAKIRQCNKDVCYAVPYQISHFNQKLAEDLIKKHIAADVLVQSDKGFTGASITSDVLTTYDMLIAEMHQIKLDSISLAFLVNFEGTMLFSRIVGASNKEFFTRNPLIGLMFWMTTQFKTLVFRYEGKRRSTENYTIPEFFDFSSIIVTDQHLLGKRLNTARQISGVYYGVQFKIATSMARLVGMEYHGDVACIRDPEAISKQNLVLQAIQKMSEYDYSYATSQGIKVHSYQEEIIKRLCYHLYSIHDKDPLLINLRQNLRKQLDRRLTIIPDYETKRKDHLFEKAVHNSITLLALFLIADEYSLISMDLIEYIAEQVQNLGVIASVSL